jgi:hypothetical protein
MLHETSAMVLGKPDGIFLEDIEGPLKIVELESTLGWVYNLNKQ